MREVEWQHLDEFFPLFKDDKMYNAVIVLNLEFCAAETDFNVL
jgi:hypothetical protein